MLDTMTQEETLSSIYSSTGGVMDAPAATGYRLLDNEV
jgi:hypothetical protein